MTTLTLLVNLDFFLCFQVFIGELSPDFLRITPPSTSGGISIDEETAAALQQRQNYRVAFGQNAFIPANTRGRLTLTIVQVKCGNVEILRVFKILSTCMCFRRNWQKIMDWCGWIHTVVSGLGRPCLRRQLITTERKIRVGAELFNGEKTIRLIFVAS